MYLENWNQDFKDFISFLNENGVEYLLIGGFAVGIHGFPRLTGDIDFWIKPSKENSEKVVKVIEAFGLNFMKLKSDDFIKEDQVFQFGVPPHRIDLMTSIERINFDDAYKEKIQIEHDGLKVNVISKKHLIENKIATGRNKDKLDAFELKKINDKPKK